MEKTTIHLKTGLILETEYPITYTGDYLIVTVNKEPFMKEETSFLKTDMKPIHLEAIKELVKITETIKHKTT